MTWLCFISSVTAAKVYGHQSLEYQSGGINMTFNFKILLCLYCRKKMKEDKIAAVVVNLVIK